MRYIAYLVSAMISLKILIGYIDQETGGGRIGPLWPGNML